MSTWLVGGDVSTGASDVIVLSNPGDVPATVDLFVYGESRAASNVVVPPKTQRGVALAAIAAGELSPVVQVVSSGAPVRAALQSTKVRTLDAVGIDVQDGVGGAQQDLQLVGVRAQTLSEGDDATGLVVRMLSPERDALATVRVRAADSAAVIDEYPVELAQSKPTEIALSGIATGVYDIEIEADQRLVGEIHHRGTEQGGELAHLLVLADPPIDLRRELLLQRVVVDVGVEGAAVVVADGDQQGVDVVGRIQPLHGRASRERQGGGGGDQDLAHSSISTRPQPRSSPAFWRQDGSALSSFPGTSAPRARSAGR